MNWNIDKTNKQFKPNIQWMSEKYHEMNKSYEQELTDDLLSIIHYYSMKSYSHRRKLNNAAKALKQNDNAEI